VQCRSVFFFSYSFIGTTCFGLSGHLQGVHGITVKDSGGHCNAAFVRPIVAASGCLVMLVTTSSLGVLGLHVVVFGFIWFVGCGCLHCSCWGWTMTAANTQREIPPQQDHSKQQQSTN
jgi:hypothetical protein